MKLCTVWFLQKKKNPFYFPKSTHSPQESSIYSKHARLFCACIPMVENISMQISKNSELVTILQNTACIQFFKNPLATWCARLLPSFLHSLLSSPRCSLIAPCCRPSAARCARLFLCSLYFSVIFSCFLLPVARSWRPCPHPRNLAQSHLPPQSLLPLTLYIGCIAFGNFFILTRYKYIML